MHIILPRGHSHFDPRFREFLCYTHSTHALQDIICAVSIDIGDDGRFDFEAEKWNKWKIGGEERRRRELPALFTLRSLVSKIEAPHAIVKRT